MRKCHDKSKDPISLVKITPIRQYDPKKHTSETLKSHETLWMDRLNTLEHGLNKRVEKGICGCIDYEREADNIGRGKIVESDKESECEENTKPRRQTPTRKCKR